MTAAAVTVFAIPTARRERAALEQDETNAMDLDDQFRRYFGTSDFAGVTGAALAAGIEHMRVDLGLERDPSRRFGLWSLLYMLGSAPDVDATFAAEPDRTAARRFMNMTDRFDAP